jgi:hypothetical protein
MSGVNIIDGSGVPNAFIPISFCEIRSYVPHFMSPAPLSGYPRIGKVHGIGKPLVAVGNDKGETFTPKAPVPEVE